jgi:hypothetical protein
MNMSLPPELLNMSAEEISQLLQLFQFLQENPDQYAAVVADLIKTGVLDEGDLPPEYDEEVVATVSALLMQALKTKQGSMAQEPQGFAMGGIADAARAVANSGRGKDTLLAHITPAEAAMLRKQGGMGTINPVTGLREYGFFSDIFKGVGKAVKSVVKGVVNVAKKIVKSPIGRIVATIALTAFLGPAGAAMGGGFFGAAAAAGVAGTSIGLLAGESLKDSLISGATAYFGAPGGPVANFVGKAGITSIAAQAAAASGLAGTAAGLAKGRSLKDSIKSGLTQAAIGGGSAIVSNYMAQADGSKSLMDAVNQEAPVLTPADVAAGKQATVENKSIPRQDRAPVTGSGQGTQLNQPPLTDADFRNLDPNYYDKVFGTPNNVAGGPKALPFGTGNDAGGGFPVAGSRIGDTSFKANYALSGRLPGADSTVSAAQVGQPAPYQPPPGIFDSAKRMGSGIMDIGQGNFKQGFKDLTGGAGDLFMPSGPTPEQIQAGKLDAFSSAKTSALARGMTEPEAVAFAKNALESYTPPDPGIMRTYGPATVAGIAGLGAMGGFEQGENQESGLAKTIKGTPGLDLIKADPRRYLVQNMYGINYTPEGAFNEANLYAQPVQRRAGGGIMAIGGYANGGEVNLTAEIAKDLMHRSMTTGAPTSEFDKYGGYDAVNALYQQGGGKYDYSGISPTQLNQLAQTVANTGVGNMRVLADTSAAAHPALTAEIAKDLMYRSMTTGAPTSEFDKYGGYDAVNALYQQGGGKYDYSGISPTQLNQFAQTVANTGVGNLSVLKDTNTPLTAAGLDYIQGMPGGGMSIADLQSRGIPVFGYGTHTGGTNTGGTNTGGTNTGGTNTGGTNTGGTNTGGTNTGGTNTGGTNTGGTTTPYVGTNLIAGPGPGTNMIGGGEGVTTRLDAVPINPIVGATPTDLISGQRVTAPALTTDDYYQYYKGRNLIDQPRVYPRNQTVQPMRTGGIAQLASGGYPRKTGQISGPGTETSDSIPAMLSDGEFVMTAGAVRGAGNGSRRAGAKKMYALMHQLERNAARS